MQNLKDLFNNLEAINLKIMKIGIKICIGIFAIAILLLFCYAFFIHKIFLYELGLCIFKLSTYFAVDFIICGIVIDMIKKQIT